MHRQPSRDRRRRFKVVSQLAVLCVLGAMLFLPAASPAAGSGGREEPPANLSSARVASLLESLESGDGSARVAVSRELFRRGRSVLPDLEDAGAKPIATVRPSRLDVVYSLINGLEAGSYKRDSFGIHLAPGVTLADLVRMGARHGFSVPENSKISTDSFPTLYVKLLPGRDLEFVLTELLTEEPGVVTVNLNYVTRAR